VHHYHTLLADDPLGHRQARNTGREMISDYAGLAAREPALAALMTVFLLSLIGIPPTAGFVGKLLIFGAALSAPPWEWLAIVGIINAVISVYYYMNVCREMYFRRGAEGRLAVHPQPVVAVIVLLALGTLVLGVLPSYVMPSLTAIATFISGG